MKFDSFTSSSDDAIDKLYKFVSADSGVENSIFYKKIESCNVRILLVTLDSPDMERLVSSDYDFNKIIALFSAWKFLAENSSDIFKQKEAWGLIDEIGQVLESNSEIMSYPLLRRFHNNLSHDHYFLLLNGQAHQGIPFSELAPLFNIWKLANGYLPFHASGVIHKGQLFIFTGASGAGKSAVAKLSQEIGDTIVDEDQLLIHKLSGNEYLADAWGYNLASCSLPIRAVFKIIQSSEDQIVPLKPSGFARLLLERHNDIVGSQVSDDLLKRSFEFVAGIARQVPGYELYFRKSPDFWKLIDERFSN